MCGPSEKCKAKEILQNEVQSEDNSKNRLLINPEYVEELDQTDGSNQFDEKSDE